MSANPANPHGGNPMRAHGYNTAGALSMVFGRAAAPVLTYNVLRHGYAGVLLEKVFRVRRAIRLPLVNKVTWPTLGLGFLGGRSLEAATVGDFWGASMVDKPGNLLVTMSGLFALRHIYWALFTNSSQFPVSAGLGVSLYNFTQDLLNSLVFVYRVSKGRTNPLKSGPLQYTGLALLICGIVMEVVAEEQRKAFKAKSVNKGKVHDSGLFGLVRHPNYLGYTLVRVGMALATGSWINATIQLATQVAFFSQYSIPELSSYMGKRYGPQFEAYRQKVKYALIPGVL